MISVIMTAVAIAMVASQKIGQSDLSVGGLRRRGSSVGICHYSHVRSLAEVVGCVCAGNRVEVIEPLVMRRGTSIKSPARRGLHPD
jgi:hypothetical protein